MFKMAKSVVQFFSDNTFSEKAPTFNSGLAKTRSFHTNFISNHNQFFLITRAIGRIRY
jgi:hypothetical protein